MPSRRDVLKWLGASAIAGPALIGRSVAAISPGSAPPRYPSKRPPVGRRKFISPAVEHRLAAVRSVIADPKLAWMFENCFPNTFDTTVELGTRDGKPDTFVITGDIEAMWLRDSSAQVMPYLPLARQDVGLKRLFHGLIRRQSLCIRIDPYANAFMPDPQAKPLTWARNDRTEMKPGVAERKWEIDSLCYPIRLAFGYWKATGDIAPFDDDWRTAMALVLQTFREQQRKTDRGPYQFQRTSDVPTESLLLDGYGNAARPNGMIFAMFRPSDDACTYPLSIPANMFAATSLRQLADMSRNIHRDEAFASACVALAQEIEKALERDGRMRDAEGHEHWAYEIDGFGNQLFMDDANAPSLLSLPYLGCCHRADPLYLQTRSLVWSARNPYYFRGRSAEGIGGPHQGLRMIWPMSILIMALTSDSPVEIRQCLDWLRDTDADTGFMHEAFDQDEPSHFTRSWFAWANTLFGELVIDISQRYPELLRG